MELDKAGGRHAKCESENAKARGEPNTPTEIKNLFFKRNRARTYSWKKHTGAERNTKVKKIHFTSDRICIKGN